MALINCPECGKEISDSAYACPHCGFPLNKATVDEHKATENSASYKPSSTYENTYSSTTTNNSSNGKGCFMVFGLPILILVLLFYACSSIGGSSSHHTPSGYTTTDMQSCKICGKMVHTTYDGCCGTCYSKMHPDR